MFTKFRRILTSGHYASVAATLALVVALGGTSYAAISIPKHSVGKFQLKKDAVVSSKVKNKSLKAQDFKKGQLPDDFSTITLTQKVTVTAGSFGVKRVNCPAGHQATGGGVDVGNVLLFQVTSSGPIINDSRSLFATNGQHPAATGWQGSAVNNTGGGESMVVSVICTPLN